MVAQNTFVDINTAWTISLVSYLTTAVEGAIGIIAMSIGVAIVIICCAFVNIYKIANTWLKWTKKYRSIKMDANVYFTKGLRHKIRFEFQRYEQRTLLMLTKYLNKG